MAVSNDPLARRGPAPVLIDGRDGRRYRLRLIAPGEPLSHEGAVNTGIALAALISRGSWAPSSSNQQWVVRLERQRGPWRGFDTLHSSAFADVGDAERHLTRVRDALERGEDVPLGG